MNDALYIAATGMNVQQRSVDTIANNLANVNTPGFKKGRVNFEDMVYRALGAPGQVADAAQPAWQGSGVGMLSLVKHFATLHGGNLEARSPGEGKGSVFGLRLPLRQQPDMAANGEPAA